MQRVIRICDTPSKEYLNIHPVQVSDGVLFTIDSDPSGEQIDEKAISSGMVFNLERRRSELIYGVCKLVLILGTLGIVVWRLDRMFILELSCYFWRCFKKLLVK